MDDKSNSSPVRLDVAAKAEAKFEIQARVPEQSMGRLVDAFTDLFRPFSEARGLRADQIRLQREEVAIEIARRARARLMVENAEVQPVPNKILIPLIEAASNEELDDNYMIDMWANLLASASASRKVEPRFVGILKELQGRQAKIFDKLARNFSDDFKYPLAHLEDAPAMLEATSLRQRTRELLRQSDGDPGVEALYNLIADWLDRPGVMIVDVIINQGLQMWSVAEDGGSYADREFDLEILSSLGLCRRINDIFTARFNYEIQLIYYTITELGVWFFKSCSDYKDMPSNEGSEAT